MTARSREEVSQLTYTEISELWRETLLKMGYNSGQVDAMLAANMVVPFAHDGHLDFVLRNAILDWIGREPRAEDPHPDRTSFVLVDADIVGGEITNNGGHYTVLHCRKNGDKIEFYHVDSLGNKAPEVVERALSNLKGLQYDKLPTDLVELYEESRVIRNAIDRISQFEIVPCEDLDCTRQLDANTCGHRSIFHAAILGEAEDINTIPSVIRQDGVNMDLEEFIDSSSSYEVEPEPQPVVVDSVPNDVDPRKFYVARLVASPNKTGRRLNFTYDHNVSYEKDGSVGIEFGGDGAVFLSGGFPVSAPADGVVESVVPESYGIFDRFLGKATRYKITYKLHSGQRVILGNVLNPLCFKGSEIKAGDTIAAVDQSNPRVNLQVLDSKGNVRDLRGDFRAIGYEDILDVDMEAEKKALRHPVLNDQQKKEREAYLAEREKSLGITRPHISKSIPEALQKYLAPFVLSKLGSLTASTPVYRGPLVDGLGSYIPDFLKGEGATADIPDLSSHSSTYPTNTSYATAAPADIYSPMPIPVMPAHPMPTPPPVPTNQAVASWGESAMNALADLGPVAAGYAIAGVPGAVAAGLVANMPKANAEINHRNLRQAPKDRDLQAANAGVPGAVAAGLVANMPKANAEITHGNLRGSKARNLQAATPVNISDGIVPISRFVTLGGDAIMTFATSNSPEGLKLHLKIINSDGSTRSTELLDNKILVGYPQMFALPKGIIIAKSTISNTSGFLTRLSRVSDQGVFLGTQDIIYKKNPNLYSDSDGSNFYFSVGSGFQQMNVTTGQLFGSILPSLPSGVAVDTDRTLRNATLADGTMVSIGSGNYAGQILVASAAVVSQTATPTSSASASSSPSSPPTPSATTTKSASPTATGTPTGTNSQNASISSPTTPSATTTKSASPTATGTQTVTGSPTPSTSATSSTSDSETPSVTVSVTPTATGTPTGTNSQTASISSRPTPSATTTKSASPTATGTQNGTNSQTASISSRPTSSATTTKSASPTTTGTQTGTNSQTASISSRPTPSSSATTTKSASPTTTGTQTGTNRQTASISSPPTPSSSETPTPSSSETPTPSSSETPTPTPEPSTQDPNYAIKNPSSDYDIKVGVSSAAGVIGLGIIVVLTTWLNCRRKKKANQAAMSESEEGNKKASQNSVGRSPITNVKNDNSVANILSHYRVRGAGRRNHGRKTNDNRGSGGNEGSVLTTSPVSECDSITGISRSSSARSFGSQPENDGLESEIKNTSLAGSIVGEEKGSGSKTPISVEEVRLKFKKDESTESKAGSVIGDISPPPSTRSSSASSVKSHDRTTGEGK